MFYDWTGNPISADQWAVLMDDNRCVKRTAVDDQEVSTVYLGLDHNWGGGEPWIFETMIFGGEHDQWQTRYPDIETARRQHDIIVAALVMGAPLP